MGLPLLGLVTLLALPAACAATEAIPSAAG
jgi:hypothetical protein